MHLYTPNLHLNLFLDACMTMLIRMLSWHRVPEECPQEVADLIQRCKAVDPQQRPSAKQAFEILRANCLKKRYMPYSSLQTIATLRWKGSSLPSCAVVPSVYSSFSNLQCDVSSSDHSLNTMCIYKGGS